MAGLVAYPTDHLATQMTLFCHVVSAPHQKQKPSPIFAAAAAAIHVLTARGSTIDSKTNYLTKSNYRMRARSERLKDDVGHR
jgi:hypothetical protein